MIINAEGREILNYSNLDLENMVTPIKIDKFCELLELSKYDKDEIRFLKEGFTIGFPIGYQGDMSAKLLSNNLPFTIGDSIDLWNKVMKEVKQKRYAGPFADIPYKDHYIQSPIGLVPKDNGRDTRLIFHLSHPRGKGTSINANTPQELSKVSYPQFDEAIRLCIKQGIGCHISRSDAQSAFRNLIIRKQDYWLLIMKARSPIDNRIYWFVDKNLPFGASISCSHFQRVSNGIAHIVEYFAQKKNINYLDDFLFAALLKALCNEQVNLFIRICSEIGMPVNLDKMFWATTILTFLGMLINTELQTVSVPIDKLQKGKDLIQMILNNKKKKVTILQLQKVCGFLNFLGKCVVPGRAFTRRLYAYTAINSMNLKRHHHLRLNGEMREDLSTWMMFLNHPTVFCRPFIDFEKTWKATEIEFYTDASGVIGFGGISLGSWMSMNWPSDFIQRHKTSIAYLELFAVAAAILSWVHRYANKRIVIFVDNTSVRDMLNYTTSGCKHCMILIRLIVLKCLVHNVRVFAKYVKSSDNSYADLLSRDRVNDFKKLCNKRGKIIDESQTEVPDEIWPIEKMWTSI